MKQRYFAMLTACCSFLTLILFASPLPGQAQTEGKSEAVATPSISITATPPPGAGPGQMRQIGGMARAKDLAHLKVVIFSHTDRWYVQPYTAAPFTDINSDGAWTARIHLGYEYAAVLVDPSSYTPPSTTFALPKVGDGVLAIARVAAKE